MLNHFKISFAFCFLFFAYANAQTNLVPNPSFEQYYSCPTNQGQVFKVKNWANFGGSPDYCNVCASTSTGQSVPNNWGFQYPASGNGYIDLDIYENFYPTGREYAGAQLLSPLTIGTKYYLSFKTSPIFNSSINLFTNNLGLLLTTYLFDSTNTTFKNFSHLHCNNVITDTTNWTQITGSFIADSAYKYVVLGNFYSTSNTQIDSTTYPSSGARGAYYYYDDIIVTTDSLLLNSINFIQRENTDIEIYPNPTSGFVFTNIKEYIEPSIIRIFNSLGELLFESKFYSSSNKTDLSFLNNGVYIIQVYNQKINKKTSLIINH